MGKISRFFSSQPLASEPAPNLNLIFTMLPLIPTGFNRQVTPCHPLPPHLGACVRLGCMVLLACGLATPARAASQAPSLQSIETRVELLSLFDQEGLGYDTGGEPTRSRANRRHPDVGYVSRDPICLTCVSAEIKSPDPDLATSSRNPKQTKSESWLHTPRESVAFEKLPSEPPRQTPGPIPVLGVVAGFGASRRLRRRIRGSRGD